MNVTHPSARSIAVWYLLMGFPGAFNLQYMPRFIVSGDAAATAANIAAGEMMYRIVALSGRVRLRRTVRGGGIVGVHIPEHS